MLCYCIYMHSFRICYCGHSCVIQTLSEDLKVLTLTRATRTFVGPKVFKLKTPDIRGLNE